ncbi:translation initiation factor IF-1 [bacterium]|nr:MAG: translation initiation factor IF-1 [bacterium]
MKNQEDKFLFEGTIIDVLPEGKFKVKVKIEDTELDMFCYESGKMRLHYIKIVSGDKVKIEVSKYDLTKGRIIQRL